MTAPPNIQINFESAFTVIRIYLRKSGHNLNEQKGPLNSWLEAAYLNRKLTVKMRGRFKMKMDKVNPHNETASVNLRRINHQQMEEQCPKA